MFVFCSSVSYSGSKNVIMMNQYLRIKKKLDAGYLNYSIDFLLELVQSENGFLLTFPANFEKALRKIEEQKVREQIAFLNKMV